MKEYYYRLSVVKLILLTALLTLLFACDKAMNEQQLMQSARTYIGTGELSAASIELRNTLQLNPENNEARYLLGSLSYRVGDLASAEKEFLRASQSGWRSDEVSVQLARVLLDNREYDRVLNDIKISESWPSVNLANIHALRALAQAGYGDISSAKSSLAKASDYDETAFHVLKSTAAFQITNIISGDAANTLQEALTKYNDNQELLLLYAYVMLLANHTEKAGDIYRKVIQLDPDNIITSNGRKAHLGLAKLLIADQNFDQAQNNILRLVERNNNDPEANYLSGLVALEQKNYSLAEQRILNVLKNFPDHNPSQLLMGQIKYKLNSYDQAAQHLSSYLLESPENPNVRRLLANVYLELGQPQLAKSTLQPALSSQPDDTGLLVLMSKIEFSTGNNDTGITLLQRAVKADPENSSLREQLALAYISIDETQLALRELEYLKNQDENNNYKINKLMVSAYLRAQRYEDALKIAEIMLNNNPDDAAVLAINGNIYFASRNRNKAREYFKKALSVDNNLISATIGLAEIEREEGNIENSIKLYKQLADSGNGGVMPMIELAEIADQQGKKQEMVDWLEKARQAAPDEIMPRAILANHYLSDNQPDMAESIIQEAINIHPDDAQVLALQGRLLLKQERYNEALTPLNRLVKLAPDSAYASVLLAETNIRLGNVKNAHAHLGHALELDPDNVLAVGLMADLELKLHNIDKSLQHALHLQRLRPDLYQGYKIEGDVWLSRNSGRKAYKAYSRAWEIEQSGDLAISLFKASNNTKSLDTALKPVSSWLEKMPGDVKTRFFLASTYLDNNRTADAKRDYQKILEFTPDNASVLNNLAWLYSSSNGPKSLDFAEKAYNLLPDSPSIQDTYGWILVQQGQPQNGLVLLKEAMSKLPENREIRYHHAVALIKSGKKEEGNRELDMLLDEGKPFIGKEDAERLAADLNASK